MSIKNKFLILMFSLGTITLAAKGYMILNSMHIDRDLNQAKNMDIVTKHLIDIKLNLDTYKGYNYKRVFQQTDQLNQNILNLLKQENWDGDTSEKVQTVRKNYLVLVDLLNKVKTECNEKKRNKIPVLLDEQIRFQVREIHGSITSYFYLIYADIQESQTHLRLSAITVFLVIILALTALYFGIRNTVLKPMQEIELGAVKIGKGDLSYRLNMTREDEIGSLGNSFDKMAEGLLKTTVSRNELAKSEKRFRDLLTLAPLPIAQLGGGDKLIFINKRFTELFGYSLEDVPDLDAWWVNAYPDLEYRKFVQKTWGAEVKKATELGIDIKSLEYQLTCKDGRELTVEVGGVVIGDELLTTFIDQTARKQAEKRLVNAKRRIEKEQEFSNSVIDSLPGLFYVISPTGKFKLWNKNFEEVSGYSHEEMAAISPEDFFEGEEKQVIASSIQEVFKKGFSSVEGNLVTLDKKHLPYLFNGVKTKVDNKELLIGMGLDISDRIQAAKEKERFMESLKRSNAELEQFAYVASHDLQEPLRMVASYTEMIDERFGDKLDDKGKKYIRYAVDGAKRMQNLINDLLMFSRVGTKPKPAEITDCNQLVKEVLHGLEKSVEEKGARITVGDLPTIMVDRSQLGMVFQNLISNAVKFSSKKKPKVEISAEKKDICWEFTVSDNGIGINPEFFDRIFVIFQRLHQRSEFPGTGIGLSIVKKIIERHGGKIRVESMENEGSKFIFTIPIQES